MLDTIGLDHGFGKLRWEIERYRVFGIVAGYLGRKAQQRGHVGSPQVELCCARLHTLQVEQLVEELRDADAFGAHRLEEFALLFRGPLLSQQQLREANKGRDQIADFVPKDRKRIRGLHWRTSWSRRMEAAHPRSRVFPSPIPGDLVIGMI